jgi:hypothetical protein
MQITGVAGLALPDTRLCLQKVVGGVRVARVAGGAIPDARPRIEEGGEGCAMMGGPVVLVHLFLGLALCKDSLLVLSTLLSLGKLWAEYVRA